MTILKPILAKKKKARAETLKVFFCFLNGINESNEKLLKKIKQSIANKL